MLEIRRNLFTIPRDPMADQDSCKVLVDHWFSFLTSLSVQRYTWVLMFQGNVHKKVTYESWPRGFIEINERDLHRRGFVTP